MKRDEAPQKGFLVFYPSDFANKDEVREPEALLRGAAGGRLHRRLLRQRVVAAMKVDRLGLVGKG
jgi:hypothetical protein